MKCVFSSSAKIVLVALALASGCERSATSTAREGAGEALVPKDRSDSSGDDAARSIEKIEEEQRVRALREASGGEVPGRAATPADAATTYKKGALFRVDLATGMHVGELVANAPLSLKSPSEYCLPDGFLWRGADYRLGRTNLFDLEIDPALVGKIVIVYGETRRGLADKLVKGARCPAGYGERQSMMQMRSDWTSPECGFTIGRSTPEKLANLSYLQARAVFELEVFTKLAEVTEERVTLRIYNPFTRALEGAQLQLHYEYRRGKPAAHFESQPIEIGAGQAETVTLARAIEIPGATRAGRPVVGELYEVKLMAMVGSAELSIPFRP
jgi:hypothetical protein